MRTDEEDRRSLLSEIRTLLCNMMMDGCDPAQVFNRRARYRFSVPSPDRIPFPMRSIFSGSQDCSGSLEDILSCWFERSEHAFLSLVSCPADPDHWFCTYPGLCPFCYRISLHVFSWPLVPGAVYYRQELCFCCQHQYIRSGI